MDLTPRLYVHHRNGEIVKIEFTNTPSNIGAAIVEHDGTIHDVGFLTHKVEGGKVVEQSVHEQRASNRPTDMEARAAVFAELQATDYTQIPDTRHSDEERAQWRDYRQALRDLSRRFSSGASMIANWPDRPDGQDPIPHLKERL